MKATRTRRISPRRTPGSGKSRRPPSVATAGGDGSSASDLHRRIAHAKRLVHLERKDREHHRFLELCVVLFVVVGLILLILYLTLPPFRRWITGGPGTTPGPTPTPPGTEPPPSSEPPSGDNGGDDDDDDDGDGGNKEKEKKKWDRCTTLIVVTGFAAVIVPFVLYTVFSWNFSWCLATLAVILAASLATGIAIGCSKCATWIFVSVAAIIGASWVAWKRGYSVRVTLFVYLMLVVASVLAGSFLKCIGCIAWLSLGLVLMASTVFVLSWSYQMSWKVTGALGLLALAAVVVGGSALGCYAFPSLCTAMVALFGLLMVCTGAYFRKYSLDRYALGGALSIVLIGVQVYFMCVAESSPFGPGKYLNPGTSTFGPDVAFLAGSLLPVLPLVLSGASGMLPRKVRESMPVREYGYDSPVVLEGEELPGLNEVLPPLAGRDPARSLSLPVPRKIEITPQQASVLLRAPRGVPEALDQTRQARQRIGEHLANRLREMGRGDAAKVVERAAGRPAGAAAPRTLVESLRRMKRKRAGKRKRSVEAFTERLRTLARVSPPEFSREVMRLAEVSGPPRPERGTLPSPVMQRFALTPSDSLEPSFADEIRRLSEVNPEAYARSFDHLEMMHQREVARLAHAFDGLVRVEESAMREIQKETETEAEDRAEATPATRSSSPQGVSRLPRIIRLATASLVAVAAAQPGTRVAPQDIPIMLRSRQLALATSFLVGGQLRGTRESVAAAESAVAEATYVQAISLDALMRISEGPHWQHGARRGVMDYGVTRSVDHDAVLPEEGEVRDFAEAVARVADVGEFEAAVEVVGDYTGENLELNVTGIDGDGDLSGEEGGPSVEGGAPPPPSQGGGEVHDFVVGGDHTTELLLTPPDPVESLVVPRAPLGGEALSGLAPSFSRGGVAADLFLQQCVAASYMAAVSSTERQREDMLYGNVANSSFVEAARMVQWAVVRTFAPEALRARPDAHMLLIELATRGGVLAAVVHLMRERRRLLREREREGEEEEEALEEEDMDEVEIEEEGAAGRRYVEGRSRTGPRRRRRSRTPVRVTVSAADLGEYASDEDEGIEEVERFDPNEVAPLFGSSLHDVSRRMRMRKVFTEAQKRLYARKKEARREAERLEREAQRIEAGAERSAMNLLGFFERDVDSGDETDEEAYVATVPPKERAGSGADLAAGQTEA